MAARAGKPAFLIIFILITIYTIGQPAQSADHSVKPPLTILYFEREPYYYKQPDGRPTGFLMEITIRTLQRAQIPFHFAEVPSKRILSMIQTQGAFCSPGWFKNPEREGYSRFSDPIYQNKPLILVIRKSSVPKLPGKRTLSNILAQPSTIGLIDGYSYGPWADREIAASNANIYRLTGLPSQVYNMIAVGRVDYTLASPEEAAFLINNHDEYKNKLTMIDIEDAPAGNQRYLIFSRAVSPQVVEKVNNALSVFKTTEEYHNLTRFSVRDSQ